jgi:hypothetical protein
MKTKLAVLFLLAGSCMFAGTNFYFGVHVGAPAYRGGYYVATPPPQSPAAYVAPAPGPGYSWVGGYYYPAGARYAWHPGYWARPPYARARWVAPRYYGHRYYGGYWRR